MSTLVWVQNALTITLLIVLAVYFCWVCWRYIYLGKSFLTDEEIIPSRTIALCVRLTFAVLGFALLAACWTSVNWQGRAILFFSAIGLYGMGEHTVQGLVIILAGVLRGIGNVFVSLIKDTVWIFRALKRLFVHKRNRE